ncbi:probable pectinesterase/pectinesterase inhibitor 51 [Phtheirospermum japonicum]|uniref:pectinesterase n=1 Tax=Phtheirospermum japonicum TaxID=374723 RepID=A0A830DCK9_9LAMI|nr:probable pectinesterase/pectinesterase inhibitor 51 [Phtheirospermum japonicum]
MAHFFSLKLLLVFFFFFFSSLSSASRQQVIHEACKASHDPPSCEDLFSHSGNLPPNATALEVIQFALNLTTINIHKGRVFAQKILTASTGNLNRSNAATICLEMLDYSKYRVNKVGPALTRSRKLMKEARAWMSAALVYQYDCWSALKYVNGTLLVAQGMDFINSTLIPGSSSALGMIANYDFYGDKTGLWHPPLTERDGFWEHVSRSHGSWSGAIPAGLKEKVTVCRGAGCTYTTVQEAVNASPNNTEPGKWFVIRIRAGLYEETVRVPLEKKNVVFLGDGMGKTVISGSMNVGQPGMSTYNSATVGVVGERFMASNLTIKNIAGSNAHQAVAFRSDSDQSVIENCEFIGNQDTLYAHTLRQYYKSCIIQGNVDFIFGNAAAFFQDCLILVAPRQLIPKTGGERNVVTAQGRTDPAQSTGLVFQNSVINGTKAYMDLYYKNPNLLQTFLGRPWKEYSRTVFIRCTLEALISKDGWMPWKDDFALQTLYYGEFKNRGPGSNSLERVPWSTQIPKHHVASYSVQNFIQAD